MEQLKAAAGSHPTLHPKGQAVAVAGVQQGGVGRDAGRSAAVTNATQPHTEAPLEARS